MPIITEKIKVIDLPKQTIIKQTIGLLTLDEYFIELTIAFQSKEIDKNEDLELDFENIRERYGSTKQLRKYVSGTDILLCDGGEYKLTVIINGGLDIIMYFDNLKEIKRIKDLIDNWIMLQNFK